MNQLDLLLQNSLAALAGGCAAESSAFPVESLEFGCVAFFKESSWKPYSWHRNAHEHRSSHPGISISDTNNQVAYGSSKLENRDPDTTLFVTHDDCSILGRTTAFLLQYSAPLTVFDVDFRKTAVEKVSASLEKKLKRKLADV